ncbi:VOC family protein [Micromonospora echinospora]
MTYGDPYAGPPDDPYATRPPRPYRDPYDDLPGDPDLDRPTSPYRDPYGETPGDPGTRPASPYRDPYDQAPDDPDATRAASAPHDPYGEPPPKRVEPVAADEPTVAIRRTEADEPTEPVRRTGADEADEPTERVEFVGSPQPVQPTDQGTSTAQDPSAGQGTSTGQDASAGAPGGTPVVPVRQRVDEPIVDPVDIPLDAPDDEPAADDLDGAIFGYDAGAGTATPISGVGITVLVTDLDRSMEFYRDTLGFTEVDRGPGNAVLASGSTRLVLREVSEAAPISRRLVHVNLEVDDIQAAYDRLREAGVRFTYAPRVVNRGAKLDVWAAAFRDPDGHGIALTQWRTRADA